MKSRDAVAWSVAGTYFEACSCVPICPCRQIGGRPGGRSTFGVCDFVLSWLVTQGHSDALDLRRRQVVMIGTYDDDEPGSPWTVSLFVDDRADDRQRAALSDIFLGRLGGTPRRNYGGAIKTVAAIETARIDLDHTRRHWRIRVDGAVQVDSDREVASDETVACGIPGLDQRGQEVETLTLRVAATPIAFEWSDRCGFASKFAYRADS